MKNIAISSALLLLLTSCGGKTSNIVSFTKQVSAEESGQAVIMPNVHSLEDWTSDHVGDNIAIDPTHTKFKKHLLKLKASISAAPVIVDNKIFILSRDGYLTAFDEQTFAKLWFVDLVSQNSKSDYMGGGITYSDGKLFVTNGSQKFDIIDISNGNVLFSKKLPDILVTKPVIDGNVIILQSISNQVYFLELSSKALVWDHGGNSEVLIGGMPIAPVVDRNGLVLVSYTSGQVSLLDAGKRAELWQLDLSVDNAMPEYIPVNVAAEPIVESGYAYIAGNNGKIVKMELATGRTMWKKEIDDIRSINNTVNALIMTTNGRQVIALDKMNGKIIWTVDIGEKGKSRNKWDPIDYSAVLMVNDAISVYTSSGDCYKIGMNGTLIGKSNIGNKLDFLTISDKIRGFHGRSIMVSEPRKETSRFKIFDKFKGIKLDKFKNMKIFNWRKKKEKAPISPTESN